MPVSPSLAAVEGGLADPVLDAQAIFRTVMDAFARPGTIARIEADLQAPPPLVPAAAAFLLALADQETPVWMEEPAGEAAAWITFQTGAPLVEGPADAQFALCAPQSDLSRWHRFQLGTAAYPDHAATLLLPVRSWSAGLPLVLSGPGIERSRTVAPAGLPDGFLDVLAVNAGLFPRGLDLLLVCGTEVMALPRTTRVREA